MGFPGAPSRWVRVQWPRASCSMTTNRRCWGTRPPVQHLLTSTAGCWGSRWREWPALHLYEPHLENGSKGAPGPGGAITHVLPSALHLGLPSSGAGVCPLRPSVLPLAVHCVCPGTRLPCISVCWCVCFSFFSMCISFSVCVCLCLWFSVCVCVF